MVTPDQNRPSNGSQPGGTRGIFDQPKRDIACRISEASQALRDTGQRLGQDSTIAGAVDRIAGHLDSAGRYVESAEPRQVVRDTQNFARRRPELFLGGALVAGLMLGRFLRSQPPADSGASEGEDSYEATRKDQDQTGQSQQSQPESREVTYGD